MHVNFVQLGLGIVLLVLSLLRAFSSPYNSFLERQMEEWDQPQWNQEYSGEEDDADL